MTNKHQKTIWGLMLMISIALSTASFAAQDFIIENRTSELFVVNGTTGNIIMAPSFGMVGILILVIMISGISKVKLE